MNYETPVKVIMSRRIVSLKASDSFDAVKKIFRENDFHHIPIVDDKGEVQGIISKENWLRDLRNITLETSGKIWTKRYYDSLTAGELMTPKPMIFDPEDTVKQAANIFMANLFHALPIVEDGQLIGIITTHDLLKYAFADRT